MRLRSAAVVIALAMVLAGCGGPESQETRGPTASVNEQAAESTATSETGSGHPAPAKLQGTWLLESGQVAGPVRLYIRESGYSVSAGAAHQGQISVEGKVIEFTSICGDSQVEGSGRYRWRISRGKLHLDPVGKDECGGRAVVLKDATYRRSG